MSNDFFQRKNATKGQQKAVVIDFKLVLYGTQNIPSIMSERSVRSIEVRCTKCLIFCKPYNPSHCIDPHIKEWCKKVSKFGKKNIQ